MCNCACMIKNIRMHLRVNVSSVLRNENNQFRVRTF